MKKLPISLIEMTTTYLAQLKEYNSVTFYFEDRDVWFNQKSSRSYKVFCDYKDHRELWKYDIQFGWSWIKDIEYKK